jgi:hypothetical protein
MEIEYSYLFLTSRYSLKFKDILVEVVNLLDQVKIENQSIKYPENFINDLQKIKNDLEAKLISEKDEYLISKEPIAEKKFLSKLNEIIEFLKNITYTDHDKLKKDLINLNSLINILLEDYKSTRIEEIIEIILKEILKISLDFIQEIDTNADPKANAEKLNSIKSYEYILGVYYRTMSRKFAKDFSLIDDIIEYFNKLLYTFEESHKKSYIQNNKNLTNIKTKSLQLGHNSRRTLKQYLAKQEPANNLRKIKPIVNKIENLILTTQNNSLFV